MWATCARHSFSWAPTKRPHLATTTFFPHYLPRLRGYTRDMAARSFFLATTHTLRTTNIINRDALATTNYLDLARLMAQKLRDSRTNAGPQPTRQYTAASPPSLVECQFSYGLCGP